MADLQVVLTVGLQASGKTTWAKELINKEPNKWKRVNKDDLRDMMDIGLWSEENEKLILRVRDTIILESLRSGYSVIIDDTNLSPKHHQRISSIVGDKADIVIKNFTDVSLEECLRRNKDRENPLKDQIIIDTYNKYLLEKNMLDFSGKNIPSINKEPLVTYHSYLSDCIICDLDGTLALLNGRNPYDSSTCENDGVNHSIVFMLNTIQYADVVFSEGSHPSEFSYTRIFLASGREERFRAQTESWLKSHSIEYNTLYMRKTGDFRKDIIIKEEIYNQYIKDRYNVLFILDDRNRIVQNWRKLGLQCWQVAEGNF